MSETLSLSIRLPGGAGKYLCELQELGLHGETVHEVASALVLDGLKRALAEGLVPHITYQPADHRSLPGPQRAPEQEGEG